MKIEMDDEGYLVIREYYQKYHSLPLVRALCTKVHQPQKCEYLQFPDPMISSI